MTSGRQTSIVRSCLAALWQLGLLPTPKLSVLLDRAAEVEADAAVGKRPPWRVALELLVASVRGEAALNEIGLTFAYVQLAGLLRLRQRLQRHWRINPAILALPIERPVIVLGHMRSGTTRLQRLLGCDPRFNHTRFYEVMNPLPAWLDLRIPSSWAQLKLLSALNPALNAVHPTSATAVEEAFGLLSFSFYGAQFEAQWRVPDFARVWQTQDRIWVYREFKQLVQTLASPRRNGSNPWVLKAPQFMEDLEPLLKVFPDARVILLNRDLEEVVASSASLVWNQMKLQSDDVDRQWIGTEWLNKTVLREKACMSVLGARPDIPRVDVAFDAMNEDWLAEMHRIYAFLGIELTDFVERRMRRYLHKAERSGFRGHAYAPEDFGLSAKRVRNAFGG